MRRPSRSLALITVAILLISAAIERRSANLQQTSSSLRREIQSSLLSLYPMGVSLSPSSDLLLSKRRDPYSFELIVRDTRSDKIIAQTRSSETQLALTWAPDESAIAFLEHDSATNHLTLRYWALKKKQPPISLQLPTLSAKLPLRWAPSSQGILVYQGNAEKGALTLITDPATPAQDTRSLGTMAHGGDMRWSPDSSRIAFTSDFRSGNIEVVDLLGATPPRTIPIAPGATITSVAWAPNNRDLYVTARPPNEEHYAVFRAAVDTLEVSRVAHEQADLINPIISLDGSRIAVEANRAGRFEVLVGELPAIPALKAVTPPNESVRILDMSMQGILHARGGPLNQAPKVSRMSWSGDLSYPLGQATVGGSTPLLLDIPTSDGLQVPTIVWPALTSGDAPPRGVVYVHGGPHLQELPTLDGRALAPILRNALVAFPNYRGSSGYGATWESAEDPALQALDVAAVISYLRREYGLSKEQITVITSSTGLNPVLHLIRLDPNLFESLVLTALPPTAATLCPLSSFKGVMYGFHGARDLIYSSNDAHQAFLACSRAAKRRDFTVLPHEGHLFHRTASWVAVLRTIFTD